MSEAALWKRMKDGVLSIEKKAHLFRIENLVGLGTPDVTFCIPVGREGFVELKHRATAPADFAGTPVFPKGKGLRDGQDIWIRDRCLAGGRAFIFCQVDTMLFLVHGVYAKEFNSMPLERLYAVARWKHIGPSPDWYSFVVALAEIGV